MNNIKKITIALISILIIIPLMGIGYVYFKLNSMYDKEEAKQINTTIEESEKNKKNGITNILLVGVDGNNMEKGNRSDAMMIATIDEKNNDIKQYEEKQKDSLRYDLEYQKKTIWKFQLVCLIILFFIATFIPDWLFMGHQGDAINVITIFTLIMLYIDKRKEWRY